MTCIKGRTNHLTTGKQYTTINRKHSSDPDGDIYYCVVNDAGDEGFYQTTRFEK